MPNQSLASSQPPRLDVDAEMEMVLNDITEVEIQDFTDFTARLVGGDEESRLADQAKILGSDGFSSLRIMGMKKYNQAGASCSINHSSSERSSPSAKITKDGSVQGKSFETINLTKNTSSCAVSVSNVDAAVPPNNGNESVISDLTDIIQRRISIRNNRGSPALTSRIENTADKKNTDGDSNSKKTESTFMESIFEEIFNCCGSSRESSMDKEDTPLNKQERMADVNDTFLGKSITCHTCHTIDVDDYGQGRPANICDTDKP